MILTETEIRRGDLLGSRAKDSTTRSTHTPSYRMTPDCSLSVKTSGSWPASTRAVVIRER